jgi:hypothetical protein
MDVKGRSASAPASPCVVLVDDAADAAAVAKVDRKYGSMLNAGSPLQILYTDQLADAKGGLKANAPCEITSVTECTCPLELQGMLKEECVDQYKLLSDRLLAKVRFYTYSHICLIYLSFTGCFSSNFLAIY